MTSLLPGFKFNWPCRACGAKEAPAFNYDKQTLEVTSCAYCEHMLDGTHIDSGECWCGPVMLSIDEKTGDQLWAHHKQLSQEEKDGRKEHP